MVAYRAMAKPNWQPVGEPLERLEMTGTVELSCSYCRSTGTAERCGWRPPKALRGDGSTFISPPAGWWINIETGRADEPWAVCPMCHPLGKRSTKDS